MNHSTIRALWYGWAFELEPSVSFKFCEKKFRNQNRVPKNQSDLGLFLVLESKPYIPDFTIEFIYLYKFFHFTIYSTWPNDLIGCKGSYEMGKKVEICWLSCFQRNEFILFLSFVESINSFLLVPNFWLFFGYVICLCSVRYQMLFGDIFF